MPVKTPEPSVAESLAHVRAIFDRQSKNRLRVMLVSKRHITVLLEEVERLNTARKFYEQDATG